MNSKNSKKLHTHRSIRNLIDKKKLKRSDQYVALSNLTVSYTWKSIKNFKIAALTWSDKFELPNRSRPLYGIEDYFQYIIKNMKQ